MSILDSRNAYADVGVCRMVRFPPVPASAVERLNIPRAARDALGFLVPGFFGAGWSVPRHRHWAAWVRVGAWRNLALESLIVVAD